MGQPLLPSLKYFTFIIVSCQSFFCITTGFPLFVLGTIDSIFIVKLQVCPISAENFACSGFRGVKKLQI